MSLEDDLRKETEKWTRKIKKEMKSVKAVKKPKDEKKSRFLENIKAYIKDSEHFTGKGDLIRAFEAIVWAWAWLEILREMEILD